MFKVNRQRLKYTYMKTVRHLNLTIDIDTYHEAKKNIPRGQVSQLFNDFLKEYMKKKSKERLIAGYKSAAKSKIVREEDKI
jgi:hypothetical protein